MGDSIGYLGPNTNFNANFSSCPSASFSARSGERNTAMPEGKWWTRGERRTRYIVSSPSTAIVKIHSAIDSALRRSIPGGVPLDRISFSSFTGG